MIGSGGGIEHKQDNYFYLYNSAPYELTEKSPYAKTTTKTTTNLTAKLMLGCSKNAWQVTLAADLPFFPLGDQKSR